MYSVVMDRTQIALVVLTLLSIATRVFGDAVAYFPLEPRAMNQYQFMPQFEPYNRNVMPQGRIFDNEHAIPQERMEAQEHVQHVLHTNAANPQVPVPDRSSESLNYTVDAPRLSEEDNFRTAKSGYDYPSHSPAPYPQAPSYGYHQPAPNYSPPSAPPASGYAPAPQEPTKISILKPDLSTLIKPVTAKVAGKVSGLIGLVLSLLTGTTSDDIEMKGFKDLVINGIVKPLLVAKGGIKSLISKLTIPLISLLLINLEVLITVWWLWEECPEQLKPTYEYTKPAYNSYR